jgi:glycosyltransferase involved in cell wall biosynthesis
VLGSSHEGLPIAILEALSYGLSVIASDIPANIEVGLPADHYFPLGDTKALAKRLQYFSSIPITNELREVRRKWVNKRYDWQRAAKQTFELYENLMWI